MVGHPLTLPEEVAATVDEAPERLADAAIVGEHPSTSPVDLAPAVEAATRRVRRSVSSGAQQLGGHNLTWATMHRLGRAIVRGDFSCQSPLPTELELCRELNVSRSILREAVKMLAARGLLISRSRRGTMVLPEDDWNLLDADVLEWLLERRFSLPLLIEFLEVRLAVEPMAAALAARDASPAAVATIAEALTRMHAADRGDDDSLGSDIAFHVAVLDASGNRFIAQLRALIDSALHHSIRLTNQMKGVRLASIADHARVLEAIVARDAEGAAAAMRVLIDEALVLVRAHVGRDSDHEQTARRPLDW